MRKADAIRLAEAAQVASDELKRLRDRIAELEAENAALRNNKTEEETLRKMMRDPRYWRQRDPEFVNKVRDGFRKLEGGK
jgi:cell division protein FtsB